MKTLGTVLLFVFLLGAFHACKDEDPDAYYQISSEDRFVFKIGDTLYYDCSNGSSLKVTVMEYSFFTETRQSTDWFGGIHIHHYDNQYITLKTPSNEWNNAFKAIFGAPGISDFESPCIMINTDGIPCNDYPASSIESGCDLADASGIFYGCLRFYKINIHSKSYYHVYVDSFQVDDNGCKMLWNLKYGIISLETTINDSTLVWNLEAP